jgi:hypothetical protein
MMAAIDNSFGKRRFDPSILRKKAADDGCACGNDPTQDHKRTADRRSEWKWPHAVQCQHAEITAEQERASQQNARSD